MEAGAMSLTEQLSEDMKQAMRSKDKTRLSVIRIVKSAIKNAEINQQTTLSDEEILDVLNKELKQRRDSLESFERAGRTDLVNDVQEEIEILVGYLPKQLTEEEIQSIVREVIQSVGATSKADMGKVMAALMHKVGGRADGKIVNQIVQQLL